MNTSRLGLREKVLLLLGVAIAAFVGLAAYSNWLIVDLREEVETLGLHRVPIASHIGEIRSASNAVPRFLWLSMAQAPGSAERAKSLEKVAEYWGLWKKSMEDIATNHSSEQEQEKIAELKELMPKFGEIIEQSRQDLVAGSREQDAAAKELLLHKMPPIAVKLTAIGKKLDEISDAKTRDFVAEVQAHVAFSQKTLLYGCLLIGSLLALIGIIYSSRLAKQLLGITNSVADASIQVSAASTQLSKSAEQLSSTSQQQAASMQETSASLTQISGMVESNAQGAEKANEYARKVHTISDDTKKTMEELRTAMASILESNGRIEQLVKVIEEIGEKTEVIDDIVFKTQLLSFNASVEAERAGEHGRGFAVVAQEVGNLAQMSGKAATEIAGIVKSSIKEASSISHENKSRVEKGESLASETGNKMAKVLSSLENILESTAKIMAASKEQSHGVSQISTSVDNLNQSTQGIASTAEESASSSEQLSGQAQSLLSLVQDLRFLVTGSSEQKAPKDPSKPITQASVADPKIISLADRIKQKSVNTQQQQVGASKSQELKKAVGSDLSGDEWEKL